jgi:hypothetical protein
VGGAQGIKVPPCFIVVCQNTAISKLVYDYVSGFQRQNDDGTDDAGERPPAAVPQLRRHHRQPAAAPEHLLIDSEQLEAGDALDDNFRAWRPTRSSASAARSSSAPATPRRQHHRPGTCCAR